MIELGPATSNDVVLAFLQAEIHCPVRGPQILHLLRQLDYDRSLIDDANLVDAHANCARAVILGVIRGYGRDNYVFTGFPNDTTWRRVSLDLDEIGRLKYVGTPEFIALSSTRAVAEGARNYRNNPKTAEKVDQILAKLRGGDHFPDLVFVENAHNELVILEGNHRATAYVIADVAKR